MFIQTTSTLNAFTGANVMSMYEVAEALDISRTRVVELEASMNTIKERLASEFKKEVDMAEKLHRDEVQKELQLQENKLCVEFEHKANINQKLHQEEIEKLKTTHTQEVEKL
jgi:hypothetical protein